MATTIDTSHSHLTHKLKSFLLITSLILPLLLFAYTAYTSYGYDDEIFNIVNAQPEKYVSAYELIQDHLSGKIIDRHPVGSFLMNYILLKTLGSWNLVRVVGGVLSALAMWLYWRYVVIKGKTDTMTVIFAYVFMCLNPAVLMWCTGLRWQTYAFPLICVLGFILSQPPYLSSRKYLFWGSYFLTASIIFYTETSAAIMIIASFMMLLVHRRKYFLDEWKTILLFGLLALLLVSRQIYLFFTVLLPDVRGSNEFYSVFQTIAGGGQNFLCGQGVVPVSLPGIMLIVANFILFLVFIFSIKTVAASCTNGFFILSYAGIIISTIGGKIRNFVVLSAPHGGFMADIFDCIKSKALKKIILALYVVGTVWGLYNVVSHNDTTRATWNTPYGELMEFLEQYNSNECFVVSHNPVFDYHAKQRGFKTMFVGEHDWLDELKKHTETVIILRTYKGSVNNENFDKFNEYVDSKHIVSAKSFSYDRYAWFKRLFDKNYPDYYAEILVTE